MDTSNSEDDFATPIPPKFRKKRDGISNESASSSNKDSVLMSDGSSKSSASSPNRDSVSMSTDYGNGDLPKLLEDHGIESQIIYPGEYFWRHLENTSRFICLTTGGFSQLQIKEMKREGISQELIDAIIRFCQECGGKMKRKRDDFSWKKFYCGCHIELMAKGMYPESFLRFFLIKNFIKKNSMKIS